MERWIQLLPECYADTLLIEMLGFTYPNHQNSINEVANVMLHKGYKNQLAIGIIDEDKRQPKYFSEFETIASTERLALKKHPDKRHFLIILSPAFEKFITFAAEAVEVSLEDYGFGKEKYFKSVCKSQQVASNQEIKQLLNTINQKESPLTEQIKTWIEKINNKEF